MSYTNCQRFSSAVVEQCIHTWSNTWWAQSVGNLYMQLIFYIELVLLQQHCTKHP